MPDRPDALVAPCIALRFRHRKTNSYGKTYAYRSAFRKRVENAVDGGAIVPVTIGKGTTKYTRS